MRIFLLLEILFMFHFSFGQNPYVRGSFPEDGAVRLDCNTFVSLTLDFPGEGNRIKPQTLNTSNIKLYPEDNPWAQIPTRLYYEYEFQYLYLYPARRLDALTSYTFELSSDLTDEHGYPFMPYKMSFQTENCSNENAQVAENDIAEEDTLERAPYVRLEKFSGFQAGENNGILSWQGLFEYQIFAYIVEYSQDSIHFDSLLTVPAMGAEDEVQSYKLDKLSLLPGNNYFRLKVSDFTEQIRTLGMVDIFREKISFLNREIALNESLDLEVFVPPGTSLVLVVQDESGKYWLKKAGLAPKDEHKVSYSLSGVPPGSYHAMLLTPQKKLIHRFKVIK